MSAYKMKIYLTFSNNWLENVVGKKSYLWMQQKYKMPRNKFNKKNVQDKMKKSTK